MLSLFINQLLNIFGSGNEEIGQGWLFPGYFLSGTSGVCECVYEQACGLAFAPKDDCIHYTNNKRMIGQP